MLRSRVHAPCLQACISASSSERWYSRNAVVTRGSRHSRAVRRETLANAWYHFVFYGVNKIEIVHAGAMSLDALSAVWNVRWNRR